MQLAVQLADRQQVTNFEDDFDFFWCDTVPSSWLQSVPPSRQPTGLPKSRYLYWILYPLAAVLDQVISLLIFYFGLIPTQLRLKELGEEHRDLRDIGKKLGVQYEEWLVARRHKR